MQPIQQAVDGATGAVVGGAAASAGALVVVQQWAVALYGVPLYVVLAGFAGVFYGLTMREPMPPLILWGNILLTTFLATATGPVLAAYYSLPPAALAGAAAIAGFVLQVAQPWLKKNIPGVMDSLREKILGAPRPPAPPTDGGQA